MFLTTVIPLIQNSRSKVKPEAMKKIHKQIAELKELWKKHSSLESFCKTISMTPCYTTLYNKSKYKKAIDKYLNDWVDNKDSKMFMSEFELLTNEDQSLRFIPQVLKIPLITCLLRYLDMLTFLTMLERPEKRILVYTGSAHTEDLVLFFTKYLNYRGKVWYSVNKKFDNRCLRLDLNPKDV